MGIPGSANPLLLLASAEDTGYQVARSLRFNSSDSAYLSRVPSTNGNSNKFTFSAWLKLSKIPTALTSIIGGGASGIEFVIGFNSSAQFFMQEITGGGSTTHYNVTSTAVFRDPSSWYHITVALDTTEATGSNRIKLWVNGSAVQLNFNTTPSLNYSTLFADSTYKRGVGAISANHTNYAYLDGYLADVFYVDGQALDPSSFVETSATTGQLIPKAYSGSYGTNGFHLDFADNSTAAALGTDVSGNGNTWTVNNITANVTQPALYSSPNLYTSAADVIANGTPLSSGSTFSNVYVYLVTNGGGNVGSKVFTADGAGTIGGNWTWLHRIGGAWTYSGSYNDTEWDLFTWGSQTVATSYIMNNSAPLHMLVSSAGSPQQVSGTIATFNSTPNSGAGNDSLVDTPSSAGTDTGLGGQVTGNYATLNPLDKGANLSLANGNLDVSNTATAWHSVRATIGLPKSGKYYWEYTINGSSQYHHIGVVNESGSLTSYIGEQANGYSWQSLNAQRWNNSTSASYGTAATANDVVRVAFDADNGSIFVGLNGSWFGSSNPATNTSPMYSGLSASVQFFPAVSQYGTASGTFNFGQRQWAYAAPAGFKALCDTNLPAPVVAKPSTVMDVKLYTGNGSTQTISGLGFSPDLVWMKARNVAYFHRLVDSVRGVQKFLYSNSTDLEITSTLNDRFNSFDPTGFTLGAADDPAGDGINQSGLPYVAWAWDAGSSTTTNNSGSISSQVRANASAGFSIVTYTGTGVVDDTQTIGHGLNAAPAFVLCKRRDLAGDWWAGHVGAGWTKGAYLQVTDAFATSSKWWSNTAPTSSVVTLGQYPLTGAGSSYVAYCFAPVAGYSSFGSYTGNGSTDGPFVYTGHRSRWIMIKNTTDAGNYPWFIVDTARSTYNISTNYLQANTSDQENFYGGTSQVFSNYDMLSNGFKIRDSGTLYNKNGSTYIYCSFAESPFQYARAR